MKKLFYGLGAIAAVATPVVAVVSCGSKTEAATGFAALKSVNDKIGNVEANRAWTDNGGNGGEAVAVFSLTHDQTVNFFKGIGLLKDGDNTAAAEHRVAADASATSTAANVSNTQIAAAKALPFQKAIEQFYTLGLHTKIDTFLTKAYEAEKTADAQEAHENLLDIQFHAEGYGLATENKPGYEDVADGKTQGTKGYSFISFKVKFDGLTNDAKFVEALKGHADQLVEADKQKFHDTVDALKKAFEAISTKTLDEIKAVVTA